MYKRKAANETCPVHRENGLALEARRAGRDSASKNCMGRRIRQKKRLYARCRAALERTTICSGASCFTHANSRIAHKQQDIGKEITSDQEYRREHDDSSYDVHISRKN